MNESLLSSALLMVEEEGIIDKCVSLHIIKDNVPESRVKFQSKIICFRAPQHIQKKPDKGLVFSVCVAGPGIEPGSGGYEPPEVPLLYPAIKRSKTIRHFCNVRNIVRQFSMQNMRRHKSICML